jgi:hypothetical protein
LQHYQPFIEALSVRGGTVEAHFIVVMRFTR